MHASSLLVVRALVVLVLTGCWLTAVPDRASADEGPWSWPLAGPHEVSRPFAPPQTTYGRGHRGADLPAAPGAPVLAAGAGRVSYAGLLAGRGVVVVVHGALRTTYEPVTASVAVGALVDAGQPVGTLEPAHAGCPVEACLHWGLRRGEEYLDPVRLVEPGPVRLLPTGPGAIRTGRPGVLAAGATLPDAAAAGGAARVRAGGTGSAIARGAAGGRDAAAAAVRGAATAPGRDAGAAAGPDAGAALVATAGAVRDDGERTLAPARTAEPAWSLRAAEAPLAAAAVAALVVGIGLLARPHPSPDDPPTAAGPAVGAPLERPAPQAVPALVAPVVELSVERERRRSG